MTTNCSICMEDILVKDKYTTPCNHTFHKNCFDFQFIMPASCAHSLIDESVNSSACVVTGFKQNKLFDKKQERKLSRRGG